jgi:hypothetical protein
MRKDSAMRHLTISMLVAAATIATAFYAAADSDSIGVTFTSDRDPSNFAVPKDTKYELNGAHTFDGGLIFGGSFQYADTTFSSQTSQNLETTVGYRVPLGFAFSMTGSAGIGQYWQQNPGVAFPYFILRIAADFEISQDITWNVISYRFRDAFDPKDNYNTPQVATGLTFKLDQQSSISVKIIRDWKNGPANDTGVSLGFKQRL